MMEERDWLDILRLIQAELRDIGLNSIAELSSYEEETFEGRRTYDARKLVIRMLKALDRHLVVHSSDTVEQALAMIRDNVGSRGLDGAVLFNDVSDIEVEDRLPVEVLRGDPRIPSALKDLRTLIEKLLEADISDGEGGATFE